jgi:FkbM family methyltransferase
MAMLARPDVEKVVAFEPNPKNLFYMTGAVLKNPGFVSKLTLFPTALGSSDGSHTMYMTPGNAGNTVLDAPVAANPISDVQKTQAQTITLDEVFAFRKPPYIHVMKIDAQGFETKILKGASKLLKSGAVKAIHFELAPNWLLGEGTSPAELFSIVDSSGYNCHHSSDAITETWQLPPALSYEDLIHIACKENDIPPRDFIAIYDPKKAAAAPNPPMVCSAS